MSFITALGSLAGILDTAEQIVGKDPTIKDDMVHKKMMGTTSLTGLLGSFVVEPTIISTNAVKSSEVYEKVHNLVADIFASFYYQGFRILIDVKGIDINEAIQIMGTNFNPVTDRAMSRYQTITDKALKLALNSTIEDKYLNDKKWRNDLENYVKFGIPVNIANEKDEFGSTGVSHDDTMEQTSTITGHDSLGEGSNSKSVVKQSSGSQSGNTAIANSEELKGMLIREIKIDFKMDKLDATINSTSTSERDIQNDQARSKEHKEAIKQFTSQTRSLVMLIKGILINTNFNNILSLCKPKGRDVSFRARWDEWRSGGISFRDLLFAGDLVQDYKKSRVKDKDKLFELVSKRATTSTAKVFTTGAVGFEASYNNLIITMEEAKQINKYLAGDIITRSNLKDEFLAQASAMTCIILDDDYQRATILIKDMSGYSTMSYRDLQKRGEKGNGNEIVQLAQAMMSNRQFGF